MKTEQEVLANETKQLNQAKLDKLVKKTGQFHSIGRRKDALARVYIQTGNGEFFVNKREINKYFTLPSFAKTALMPLELVKFKTKMNVKVFVKGGGISGQAGAVKLGLSRALSKFNPEWRVKFRSEGFLTRDSRVVSFASISCSDFFICSGFRSTFACFIACICLSWIYLVLLSLLLLALV